MSSPIQGEKQLQVSLQFKVFLYLSWEYHPIQGIPCNGLSLFPNTRWWHFAIQGRPACIGYWLYYVTSQSKVMSSNTRWQFFPIKFAHVLGFGSTKSHPYAWSKFPIQSDNISQFKVNQMYIRYQSNNAYWLNKNVFSIIWSFINAYFQNSARLWVCNAYWSYKAIIFGLCHMIIQ